MSALGRCAGASVRQFPPAARAACPARPQSPACRTVMSVSRASGSRASGGAAPRHTELLSRYEQDGYIVVPSLFTRKCMAETKEQVRSLLAGGPQENDRGQKLEDSGIAICFSATIPDYFRNLLAARISPLVGVLESDGERQARARNWRPNGGVPQSEACSEDGCHSVPDAIPPGLHVLARGAENQCVAGHRRRAGKQRVPQGVARLALARDGARRV